MKIQAVTSGTMALPTPIPGKPVAYDARNIRRPKDSRTYSRPKSIFTAPAPRPVAAATTPQPIGWNRPAAQTPLPAAPAMTPPKPPAPALPAMSDVTPPPAAAPQMSAPAGMADSLPFVKDAAAREQRYQAAVNSPTAQANRMKFTGRPEPIAQQQALAAAAAQKPASPATQSAGTAGDFGPSGAAGSPAGATAPAAKPTLGIDPNTPFGRGMNGEPALSERPFGMSMNGEVNPTALQNSISRKQGPAPLLPRPKLGATEGMINARFSRTSGRMTGRRRNKFADGPYRGKTAEDAARMLDEEADAMSQYQM